jgi:intracellular sulfur oxidation DsrE/DsrF family protein
MTEGTNGGPVVGDGVVVHLDEADPDKHEAVLRNIGHMLSELGADTPVELVAHGPGLAVTLSGAVHEKQVLELLSRGVSVAACGNTIRRQNLTSDALIPGVSVVPAGIAQIVRRQREGWAYVRP